MKIFAFTDTHGNKSLIEKLIKDIKKESPHLLICCGDLSNFSKGFKTLINKFKKTNTTLLIIPGNHETPSQVREACQKTNFAIPLHKASYELNDYIFFGYGTGGFDIIDKSLEKLIPKFKKTIKKPKKVITITHAPPYKTKLDIINSEHHGSKSIRKLIENLQPKIHLCGHLHENAGNFDKIKNTIVLNPGHGKIIEL